MKKILKLAKKIKKSFKKILIKKPVKKPVKKPSVANRAVKRKKRRKEKKNVKFLRLIKHEENPIISPKSENKWESWQTFNPGAILLNNKIHFLYRAIGSDGISRFGYAASNDGFSIDKRLSYPVYEHKIKNPVFNIFSCASGGSWSGAEDPRIVRVNNEDTLYMTYTACDRELRMSLTSIKVADFLENNWKWNPPVLISEPGEMHKNWVIFPEKINGLYAVLHSISPEVQIEYLDNLEFKNNTYIKSYHTNNVIRNSWDKWVRGVGPVPIKTKYGWLIFYHAMDNDWSKYRVGAMLLDFQNPTKALYRSAKPVLEPQEDYENCGSKPGVVYVSGAVVKDNNLLVYYGGADNFVCVAFAPLEEFLKALLKKKKPKLKRKTLKKK